MTETEQIADTVTNKATNVFVVLNPVAGRSNSQAIRQSLEKAFETGGQQYEIIETTGAEDEDIAAMVRDAVARGSDLVVAVGGDGTVSEVANALVGSDVPLAVIAAGTANVFARELKIPINIDEACALLAGEHSTANVDLMKVGHRHFILQIGIGIGSLMIRDTSREAKGRFGRLAYMATAFQSLFGFQPRRFMLVIDKQRYRHSASEVLLANGGVLGIEPFRWGPGISPDDGKINVCVVSARTFKDYLGVTWHTLTGQQKRSRGLHYYTASESISINTKRPLPIQADGEIIGNTPLQVSVVPGALRVAVPVLQPAESTQPAAQPAPALSATPAPMPISPEVQAEVAPVEDALKQKLRQIKTPEQASRIADELLAAAGTQSEQAVRAQQAPADQPAEVIQQQAEQPGTKQVAETLIETAKQVATNTGERREALEQAVQRATNPEQQAELDPELVEPLDLLRQELLRRMQPWQAVDTRVFLAINHLPHTHLSNQAMYALTTIMNGGWGWTLGLLAASLRQGQSGRRVLREFVPPLWFSTMLVEYPIKFYFRRKRPFIDIVKAISVGRKPGTYSFPSGHSAAAFAGAWLITRQYPELASLWYAIAVSVGFSRIYLGAHYPSDVLSGAVIGTVLAESSRRLLEMPSESK